MFATQALPEVITESGAENESDIVGFIIVENKKYEVKKGETKIGRDAALCSVVIDNCTISKVHATVESEGIDDSFIYDVGSTNRTKLGKKILKPHCRYKLDHNSELTFGNISAKFILPTDFTKTDSVNSSLLDELGDIFDAATQVCVPETSATNKIPVFEKLKDCINSYKISNLLHGKVTEFPKSDVAQCRVETKSKTDQITDSSNIFSLNTQCQIYEPNEVSNNNFLNDGQDDVLCTFMSLHSPKAQNELEKETKIKTKVETSSQAIPGFEVESSCQPNNTSTPLNSKFRQNQPNDVFEGHNNTQNLEEDDFIKTQEFNFDSVKNNNSALQDSKTEPYLGDVSTRGQINEGSSLSQVFQAIEKSHPPTAATVIPESKGFSEEDFSETQLYDAEKEAEEVIPTDRDADTTLDFTQRNNLDDFVPTQIFEKETKRQNDETSEAGDDEDFIATQLVEINKYQSSKNSLKSFSRESSPDLLCSGSTQRNSEDLINTQAFECQNATSDSGFYSHFNKKNECNIYEKDLIESSGDETESDLEIILEKNNTNVNVSIDKPLKLELQSINSPQCEDLAPQEDSNSSYSFEPKPDTQSEQNKTTISQEKPLTDFTDSDATDCEEINSISPRISMKEERLEKIEFEETQVLTLTPPNNFTEKTFNSEDDWMVSQKSPRFEMENEPCSPLSLEMPSTQDIESSLNKILYDETKDVQTSAKNPNLKVGFQNSDEVSLAPAERQNDSPLKRPIDTDTSEVEPFKKPKIENSPPSSEKQFLKLVKAHDIAQIQPCRTRNSLRLLAKENKLKNDINAENSIANEGTTSRRKPNPKRGRPKKLNGDITSYLTIKKRSKRGTSLKENQPDSKSLVICTRVLRSSLENPISPVLTETFSRSTPNFSRRRSSRRNGECYNSRCVRVVFTGFECERLERIVFDLGGEKTNDLCRGDVVVADKVRRTVKFLCATGLGLPIASPEWLLSCKREETFLDPWRFILKDEASEEKWGFDLKTSLEKSKNTKLLQGFNVFATENTKPPVKDLLAIVECCGGTPLPNPPSVWPKKTIVVSCLEDKKWWPPPKLRNVKVVHYEFILRGVLRQKIDFKTYELR